MAKNWRKPGGTASLGSSLSRGLQGAGADLLFGGDDNLRDTVALRLVDIVPNPDQPRRIFDEAELQLLASSMQAVGQLSPILVKPHPTEPRRYLLIAGERRWRAAELAGMGTIAAHILADDTDTSQIALIENLQRVNLSPIEEAEGVQRLIDRHGYNQEQAGALLSRSRTEVNTTLTLLRLDPAIREECVTSHTDVPKALLLEIARMETAEQRTAWEQAKAGKLTARLARSARRDGKTPEPPAPPEPGAMRPSMVRFIGSLPRLQKTLDTGLEALDAEKPRLSRMAEDRLRALRERLDDYARMLDRVLDER